MKRKIIFIALFLAGTFFTFAQRTTVNITEKVVSVASYTDKEVIIDGQSDLHLTSTSNLLNNSIINLNSVNSWVFFDNVRPDVVINSLLQYIYINNQSAVLKTNVRVSIYKQGTVVIPQSSSYQPITVFTGQNFTGDSTKYSLFSFNKGLGSTFENQIRSFRLKRGYMVTLATNPDGMGYSRVYIADNTDLVVPEMPDLLDKSISFIRVLDWEWVSKKGWCGYNPTEYGLTKSTWRYDWSASGNTESTIEYVPIRQNGSWPGWSEINGKQYVSHVLGFNEPDHTEQSNLTVAQAVAQWPDMIRTGLRVGSPACTNFSWLYQFMDSCKAHNYRVDYVAVHAYWGGKSPQNWYNDLKYIHDRTGRPIWITEWNNGANWTTESWPTSDHSLSTANAAKQLSDIKAILNVLDTASFIERYSIYNWVQDCRAMVLNGVLTPAGQYYADDKSPMAFNRKYEVIPSFKYGTPSLSISIVDTKLSLNISDPNAESFNGFILEKKTDNGDYTEFYRSENSTSRTALDTIDINTTSKVRYRVRTILASGTITNYSNEIGWDVTRGNDVQYGNLSFSNVGWNTVFFKKGFTTSNLPAIILGAPTNYNSSVLLTPRAKLVSASSRFNLQLAPWAYQHVTSLTKDETVPYFIIGPGSYNFGGLKALAGKTTFTALWRTIAFDTPFDTIPVVFATQLNPYTANATTVRVRNVTKTGFDACIQKESAVSLTPSPESVSFFAITTGTGVIGDKKIIVGKTANNAISSSIYTTINYGDSIANPIFLAQLQSCNDDTVTATLRCLTIANKFANVVKQRERSRGIATSANESAAWMVISDLNEIQGLNDPQADELQFYPNPVKDYIYLKQNSSDNFTIEIHNMLGLLVKRAYSQDNKIDLEDLSPGCYILRTEKHGSKKFIKM